MSGSGGARSSVTAAVLRATHEGSDGTNVEEVQRARLVAGAIQAACQLGAGSVTVASVLQNASVSRRTFYNVFSDVDACLLEALNVCLESVGEHVLPAYESATGGWRQRIRAGLAALLEFFDADPYIARMLLVEWKAAGAKAAEWQQEVLAPIAAVVDEGRAETRTEPSPLTAEGVVGAVMAVLYGRVLGAEPREPLIELLNPLMSTIVLPYLGARAARSELDRPMPELRVHGETGREGTLTDLNIRVTYRTIRVLTAVASQPGVSNGAVARAAGVGDQGQMSKLLKRLEGAGLIENRRLEEMMGRPNEWWLTAHGESVMRVLNLDAALGRQ
jgi:AcrR family transcriptional regulator